MARVTSEYEITLDNLGNGVVAAKFQRELEKVLTNIDDPNKKEGLRKISIVVAFKYDETSGMIQTDVDCSSTLQPDKAYPTILVMGMENGKPVAREYMKQEDLPMEMPDNVRTIPERQQGT